jgi:hypothetical protein
VRIRWLLVFAALAMPSCAPPSRPATATPHAVEPVPDLVGDHWAPLRSFVGRWNGTGNGEPGQSTVEREYRGAVGGRYLWGRNRSVYPPQEKNPKGETHDHWDIVSWDKNRKTFVLRQFHVEGFVNQYRMEIGEDGALIFTSEAIENISAGWRARETYRFVGEQLVEVFELAPPGKDFSIYSRNVLQRAR